MSGTTTTVRYGVMLTTFCRIEAPSTRLQAVARRAPAEIGPSQPPGGARLSPVRSPRRSHAQPDRSHAPPDRAGLPAWGPHPVDPDVRILRPGAGPEPCPVERLWRECRVRGLPRGLPDPRDRLRRRRRRRPDG